MTIKVTPYHLRLLDKINIRWDFLLERTWLDPVNVYGKQKAIYDQIGAAFGWNKSDNINNEWAEEEIQHMWSIHKDMHFVLDILAKTRSLELGFYKIIDGNWTKLDAKTDDVLPGQLGFEL